MTTAVVRADGSTALGHGHIFRTLVLADELAGRGWKIQYVCRDLPGAPLERVRRAGYELVTLDPGLDEAADAEQTAAAARRSQARWVIVDRYDTDERAHARWAAQGLRLLAIDDLGAHPFEVDVLLNQNSDASVLPYVTRSDTERLLGPGYALVRPAYRAARPGTPRPARRADRVLVFMGGADQGNATGFLLQALEAVPRRLEVQIVIGSAYPHSTALADQAAASRHHVSVLRDLPDLAGVMGQVDAAISAGGSVVWELACLGVPMMLTPIAYNQEGIAASLAALGAAIDIGPIEKAACDELAKHLTAVCDDGVMLSTLSKNAWQLVDGLGAARVVEALERAA